MVVVDWVAVVPFVAFIVGAGGRASLWQGTGEPLVSEVDFRWILGAPGIPLRDDLGPILVTLGI